MVSAKGYLRSGLRFGSWTCEIRFLGEKEKNLKYPFWSSEIPAVSPSPTTKMSADWIIKVHAAGPCFENVPWSDAAHNLAVKLQTEHSAEFTPVAGAGAGFRAFDTASRNAAFLRGEFETSEMPKQLAMPSLAIVPINETELAGKDTFGLHRACACCGARSFSSGGKLKSCSKCLQTKYCSKECQVFSWTQLGHSKTCGQPVPTPQIVGEASTGQLTAMLQQFGDSSESLAKSCLGQLCKIPSADINSGVLAIIIPRIVQCHPGCDDILQLGDVLLDQLSAPSSPIQQLDDSLQLAVLIRLPRSEHQSIQLVCRRWRCLVRNESFVNARRACPVTGQSCMEDLVLIVGGQYDGNSPEEIRRIGADRVASENFVPHDRVAYLGSPMHHGRTSMLIDGKKWIQAGPAPLPMANGHVLVALNEVVYLLGGSHPYLDLMSPMMSPRPCTCFLMYDPRSHIYRAGPPMTVPRSLTCACAGNDGRLYVFGGITNASQGQDIAACECYDPLSKSWSMLPPLPFPCHSASVVSIGRKIFVMGGNFMPQPTTHARMQVFDTASGKWTRLKTQMPRAGAKAVAYGADIICLGGTAPGAKNGGSRESRDIWSYSTKTMKWTQLAMAPQDRISEGYFYLDGSTIRDAQDPKINFSISENRWVLDPQRQPCRNHYHGSDPVVVSVPF
jgi:hypothetical protein